MFKFFFIFFLFITSSLLVKAQQPEDTSGKTNVYKIYEEQVKFLLEVRGVPGPEIMEMLKIIRTNKINSDEALAELLGKLYSSKGALVFFSIFSMEIVFVVFFLNRVL